MALITKKKSIFDLVPTGDDTEGPLTQQVGRNVSGMLSGTSYDAEAQKARTALARAAKGLRSNVAAEGIGTIGQGTAAKAQQETNQQIFSALSDTELNIAAQRQATKEKGITTALGIAQTQEGADLEREKLASTERTAAAGTALEQQKLAENQRQFNVSTAVGQEQFSKSLAQKSESEKAQLASAEKIAGMNITSTEKIAAKSAAIDEARLSETARQFNLTSEQTARQFTDTMKYNYDELDANQKNFLASLGLDQAKFEESKVQFNKQLEQEGRLTMANLAVEEKKLAEQAREFDTQDQFNKSELAANLSESEKQRVWQATQNTKANENAITLATMQKDLETWKTNEATKLTELGYTREAAENALSRRSTELMQEKELATQRLIANGELTQKQAEMVQQASQFTSQLDWEKKATELKLSADEADKIWQTNERIASNAFAASEASKDRQLEKMVETKKISLQEKELAQQAFQFKTQQEFNESQAAKDLSEADKNRAWQTAENALDREFDAQQNRISQAFQEKGWNYQALLGSIDNDLVPEAQVADFIKQSAIQAGIGYTKTDSDGTEVFVPGFKQAEIKEVTDLSKVWKPGSTMTSASADGILKSATNWEERGVLITDNIIESSNIVNWKSTGKVLGQEVAGRWALDPTAQEWVADNVNKLYKASNGRLYEVVGIINPKDANSRGSIVFRDAVSGTKINFTRGSEFPKEV